MKKLTIALSILTLSFAAYAGPTNAAPTILTNTNIQNAISGILMGVKDAGGEVFNASKDVIAGGIDLVKTQAPELITEFLKWKFTEAMIWFIFSLTLLTAGIIAAVKFFTYYNKHSREYGSKGYILGGVLFGILPAIAGLIMSVCNIFPVIQIWIAPKIYLLEYVMARIHN